MLIVQAKILQKLWRREGGQNYHFFLEETRWAHEALAS